MIMRCISYANVWYLNISLVEVFYKTGHYRMQIKISTCYISWMVQAVDLIDYNQPSSRSRHTQSQGYVHHVARSTVPQNQSMWDVT